MCQNHKDDAPFIANCGKMNIFYFLLPLLGWIIAADTAFSPPIHVSGMAKFDDNIPASHRTRDNHESWRTRTAIGMSGTDEADGFKQDDSDSDPDLLGVYVDGFPLPKIPSREDDDELLASIRRLLRVQPIDTWQAPGEISAERPLRVIIVRVEV
jgi:hypothetical protein